MSGIHYRAATKRTFKQALIFLLEHEYKLLGSHRVLEMIADDVVELHHEFRRHDCSTGSAAVRRGWRWSWRHPRPTGVIVLLPPTTRTCALMSHTPIRQLTRSTLTTRRRTTGARETAKFA